MLSDCANIFAPQECILYPVHLFQSNNDKIIDSKSNSRKCKSLTFIPKPKDPKT